MKFYPKEEVLFDEKNILVWREFSSISEYVFIFSERSYYKENTNHNDDEKSTGWECDRRGVFV
jgi:hypothetical protein